MKKGAELRLKHCEGEGPNRECEYAKLFVKTKQKDNPIGKGKVNVWDEGSRKVVQATKYTDIALEIVDVNDPENYDMIRKHNIKKVPTILGVNGTKLEGTREIMEAIEPRTPIKEIEEA